MLCRVAPEAPCNGCHQGQRVSPTLAHQRYDTTARSTRRRPLSAGCSSRQVLRTFTTPYATPHTYRRHGRGRAAVWVHAQTREGECRPNGRSLRRPSTATLTKTRSSARMNKWTTTTMRARPHPRGDTTPSRTSTLTKLSRATPRASRLSNTTSHAPPTMTTLRTPPTITTRTHTPAAITSSNPEERLPLSLPCAQPDLL